jgi:hypothetical protein
VNDHSQITDSTYIVSGNFYSQDNTVNIGPTPFTATEPDFVGIVRPNITGVVTSARPGLATAIQVYPNPARGRVTVQTAAGIQQPVLLTDATGKEVLRLAASGQKTATLNTASLPAGLYRIQCGTFAGKLALER